MQDTVFNPDTFLETSVEGEMSTEYSPIPEDDYLAVITETGKSKLAARRVTNKETGEVSFVMDVPCKIDAPGNEDADGKLVRFSAWLDFTENGSLDLGKGKNVRLGQIRAAVGQNDPSKPWKPSDLLGQALRVNVKHSDDGKYANVDSVGVAT